MTTRTVETSPLIQNTQDETLANSEGGTCAN
jgi:hypothetical protein